MYKRQSLQLLGSRTSPFVRQVRVTALEKGLGEALPLRETNPFENDPALLAANPLGKVPAVVGTPLGTLHDSRLLCEYIDSLRPEPPLLPMRGDGAIVAAGLHHVGGGRVHDADGGGLPAQHGPAGAAVARQPVSYTHLTLPTIYSV